MSEYRKRTVKEIQRQVAVELALGAHLRIMEAGSREFRFKDEGIKPSIDVDAAFADAERIFDFLCKEGR